MLTCVQSDSKVLRKISQLSLSEVSNRNPFQQKDYLKYHKGDKYFTLDKELACETIDSFDFIYNEKI